MHISFDGADSRKAGSAARELSLALAASGANPSAMSVTRASDEAMDLGSIFGIDLDMALQALEYAAKIGVLAKCIYDIAKKNRVNITIKTSKGEISIPEATADIDDIERRLKELEPAPASTKP